MPPRLLRPPPRPFTWAGFVMALAVAGLAQFAVALGLDAALRQAGLALHPWRDAAWSVLVGGISSFFIAPVFWRMGLVNLPQYLIGAFAVMAPITVLSFVLLASVDRGLIAAPWAAAHLPGHAIALTAYVRLIRAVVLVPVWLGAFYWVYHVRLNMAPRR